jgi:hypothetical protein
MSIASKAPKFNEKSFRLLGEFDANLRARILNFLEDRMQDKNSEDISEDDVRFAINQAIAELQHRYGVPR